MKVGVVSDTHRNTGQLLDVADWLIDQHGIAALYHLGDDYADAAVLAGRAVSIVQVPGIYHPGYYDGSIAAKAFESPLGVRMLLVHARERDVTKQDLAGTDVVLHGHTHVYELRMEQGRLFMNPGHLKGKINKHAPASFGLLDIHDKTVTASVYNLSYQCVAELRLVRSDSGLYRDS